MKEQGRFDSDKAGDPDAAGGSRIQGDAALEDPGTD